MFCTSTKIVVIGSNIKRKAGPRVGSLGFIVTIDNGQRTNYLPGCIAFSPSVIFTRYGYEKKPRIEQKRPLIVVPEMEPGANARKSFNKAIRLIKTSKLKSVVLACPIETRVESKEEFCAWIFSRMNSMPFVRMLNKILKKNPFGSRESETNYWNIEDINEKMPDHVREFSHRWLKSRKLWQIYDLIINYYYGRNHRILELIQFIQMCEFLSDKVDIEGRRQQYRGRFFHSDKSAFFSNMYKIHGLNEHINNMYEKERQPALNYINSITNEIDQRGYVTLNKHK